MSLITDLPAIFDQFSEARQKGFLTVMNLKSRVSRWWEPIRLRRRRSRWRRVDGGSRCAQRRMKPSKKPKKIYRATSAR